MYHYVKDFQKYTFSKLKGLDVREFESQIKFLKSKFTILDPQDIHEIASKKKISMKITVGLLLTTVILTILIL